MTLEDLVLKLVISSVFDTGLCTPISKSRNIRSLIIYLRMLEQLTVARTSQKWKPEVKAMFVRTSSSSS